MLVCVFKICVDIKTNLYQLKKHFSNNINKSCMSNIYFKVNNISFIKKHIEYSRQKMKERWKREKEGWSHKRKASFSRGMTIDMGHPLESGRDLLDSCLPHQTQEEEEAPRIISQSSPYPLKTSTCLLKHMGNSLQDPTQLFRFQ